jgi:hypothetical protein
MAIDYWHRLIIRGPRKDVRAFERRIYREYPRSIAGKSWTEIVPFSFTALYEMAPAACRIKPEPPAYEPYALSAWPVRRLDRNQAEVRYQFQTRNLEMVGFIRVLSRALSSLTFALVTLCLDSSSIEVYRLKGGSMRRWTLPQWRQDFHWNRARNKFGLAGDDVYEDDDAEHWAEEEMLYEALTHWDNRKSPAHSSRRSRYQWWNRPRLRDLMIEKQLFVLELEEKLRSEATRRRAKRGRARKISQNNRPRRPENPKQKK